MNGVKGGKMKGRIIFFDESKGWGLVQNLGGEQLFFHRKNLKNKSVLEVEFNVKKNAKGLVADNVRHLVAGR